MIKKLLSTPLFVSLSLLIAAVGALGSALTAQYAFGLAPCPLCIYQRWPFVIIGVLGLLGILFSLKKQDKRASFAIFLAALAFLAGGMIAFYHTGVEQHWWKSVLEGCTVTFDTSAADLLKQIEGTQAARCDVIPWSLFGISMAGYNAIISLLAAPLYALSALLVVRRANGL